MMKFFFFLILLLPLSAQSQLLGPDYWNGDKPQTESEKLAKKVCKCMHRELMSNEVDLSEWYDQMEVIQKDKKALSVEAFDQKWGEIKPVLRRAEATLFQIEESDCYKKTMEKFVPSEGELDAMEQHLEKGCVITQLGK